MPPTDDQPAAKSLINPQLFPLQNQPQLNQKNGKYSLRWCFVAAVAVAGFAIPTSAQIVRTFAGSAANSLARNDDRSTRLVNVGFNVNFFGTVYSQLYVNNNGNLTFAAPLRSYTPSNLLSRSTPIIAPFFADVDTRGSGSSVVTYGSGTLGGLAAFVTNYINVGAYNRLPLYNSFQLVMINRSDITPGDFDFEFNYSLITWEAGRANGSNRRGLGGSPARAGYSNGASASFEIAGSAINGAFLDTNTLSVLVNNQFGTPFDGAAMDGRYTFNVRNGVIFAPVITPVPEPSSFGMFAVLGLFGIVAMRRRQKN